MMRAQIKYLLLCFTLALSACAGSASQTQTQRTQSLLERLSPSEFRAIVNALASDEFKGRKCNTEEGEKAAEFVAHSFEQLGLRPAGENGSYFQKFHSGVNVLARLEGRRTEEYIVIAAHHDHLGMRRGKIYRGADDNASGVAMLLMLARLLAQSHLALERSVLFISFDAEEKGVGMVGSRYFVASKLYGPKRFAAMICFDLIGGNMTPWDQKRVYALGSESCSLLHEKIKQMSYDIQHNTSPLAKLDLIQLGIYLIEPLGPMVARSDYAPFRDAGVPFIFFSTGTPWYYHTEFDTPERLNYNKMVETARVLFPFIVELTQNNSPLTFGKEPVSTLEEAYFVRDTIQKGLCHYRLPQKDQDYLESQLKKIDAMIARGIVEKPELLQQAVLKVMMTIARERNHD